MGNPRNKGRNTGGNRDEQGRKKEQETRAGTRGTREEHGRNKGRRIRAGESEQEYPRDQRDEAMELPILLYPL